MAAKSPRRSPLQLQLEISNDSSLKRVPRQALKRVVELTLRQHRVTEAQISLVFLNDRVIRRLNKQFLEHDYATDVITFALEDKGVDGEIYISVETAARQAKEYSVSLTNELQRLVIHGILHLCGFDDATDKQRQEMHRQENIILNKEHGIS